MKTASPLPDDFHGRPFTVAEAAAAGVSVKRLRHRSLDALREAHEATLPKYFG